MYYKDFSFLSVDVIKTYQLDEVLSEYQRKIDLIDYTLKESKRIYTGIHTKKQYASIFQKGFIPAHIRQILLLQRNRYIAKVSYILLEKIYTIQYYPFKKDLIETFGISFFITDTHIPVLREIFTRHKHPEYFKKEIFEYIEAYQKFSSTNQVYIYSTQTKNKIERIVYSGVYKNKPQQKKETHFFQLQFNFF